MGGNRGFQIFATWHERFMGVFLMKQLGMCNVSDMYMREVDIRYGGFCILEVYRFDICGGGLILWLRNVKVY